MNINFYLFECIIGVANIRRPKDKCISITKFIVITIKYTGVDPGFSERCISDEGGLGGCVRQML